MGGPPLPSGRRVLSAEKTCQGQLLSFSGSIARLNSSVHVWKPHCARPWTLATWSKVEASSASPTVAQLQGLEVEKGHDRIRVPRKLATLRPRNRLACSLSRSHRAASRRAVLKQIHDLGPDAIGPLIEALGDSRLAPFAVTALVEFGPLAKKQLVRALHSANTQTVIHAGEVLSRAGLDEDL